MKCISLLQPWASLVATGAKRVETRSWTTAYRGPLAIHASKRFGAEERSIALSLAADYPAILQALRDAGLQQLNNFPCGAIIAVCTLRACIATTDLTRSLWRGDEGHHLTQQEAACGDDTPGRWAWLLEDVRALPEPIPAKGSLGLWEYPLEAPR